MFDFNEIIDRKNTNALSVDGFEEYLFSSGESTKAVQNSNLVRMWIADMDFATPVFVREAIRNRLDQKILGYSKIFDQEYYGVFNNWLNKQYGWNIDSEHLQPSAGIIPALYDLVSMLTKEDEKVLILTPSYGYFEKAVLGSSRELVCSALVNVAGKFVINYDEIAKIISDEKVTMCIFCHPHNPTGRDWQIDELERFGQLLIEKNIWIISDEIHCDLLRTGHKHLPMAMVFPGYERIITCMSPSKTFNMAGMMLANIIIPSCEARTLWKRKNNGMVNPLAIAGVQAAYIQGEHYLSCLRNYLDDNFKFLAIYLEKHLPHTRYTIPEATYLAWIDLRYYLEKDQFDDIGLMIAQDAGVLVESGKMFVRDGAGFIRLNLAVPQAVLLEGLERLCGFVNGMNRKKS